MRKIVIANRGEIAVRIIRACREMGIASVAVYSDSDRAALHVRMADEACAIGPSPPADSYLRIDRILDAAIRAGADAIHPGYGFLSENAAFARACRERGVTFIGPSPEAIALMGSKTAARQAAAAAGVSVVPGTDTPVDADADDRAIRALAGSIGYPVMIKAVAGGGGKGMRVASSPDELSSGVRAARSEAMLSFGDGSVYLERVLRRPRHVEVQLLADEHGTVVPFVERECSIQRRHQKVIEESPSPAVGPALRAELMAAATAIARHVGYTNAGTIEFLLDENGRFYFLEMNTRIQVEHPITEMITGIDLVRWQIRVARGERLDIDPARAAVTRGHAIECRVYAEDPEAGFVPSPGRITRLVVPSGPWVRNDVGIAEDGDVPIFYDALVSKLIAWGDTRAQALETMSRALAEYQVVGIATTVGLFRWLLRQPEFVAGAFHTRYLDELLQNGENNRRHALDVSLEEVAGVMAAVRAALRGTAPARAVDRPVGLAHEWKSELAQDRSWKSRARIEGLRH